MDFLLYGLYSVKGGIYSVTDAYYCVNDWKMSQTFKGFKKTTNSQINR